MIDEPNELMAMAAKMPETPEELAEFVGRVIDLRVVDAQREVLEEMRRFGERQARVEGRVEELGRVVGLYREDFRSLLERFDHFQAEVRRENEAFRQEIRTENEKFRQEVGGRFEKIDARFEKIDARFERMEGRLFEMQRSLTIQTRWLVGLLVAAPVIYSVMDRLLGRLLP